MPSYTPASCKAAITGQHVIGIDLSGADQSIASITGRELKTVGVSLILYRFY
jgi:hypothetical protein